MTVVFFPAGPSSPFLTQCGCGDDAFPTSSCPPEMSFNVFADWIRLPEPVDRDERDPHKFSRDAKVRSENERSWGPQERASDRRAWAP